MTEKSEQSQRRSIAGQVVLDATGTPVAGVVLRAYDVSTGLKNTHRSAELNLDDVAWITDGRSLGSVISARDGWFSITYTLPVDLASPVEMALVAFWQTTAGSDSSERAIHVVPKLVHDPGEREEFLLQLTTLDLSPAPDLRAAGFADAVEANQKLAHDIKQNALDQVARTSRAKQAKQSAYRTYVETALQHRARAKFIGADGDLVSNYVDASETVPEVQKRAFSKTLKTIGSARFHALIDLDEDARAELLDAQGALLPGITSKQISDLLKENARNPVASNWSFFDAIGLDCRRRRFMQRIGQGNGPEPVDNPDDPQVDGTPPLSNDDIKSKLTALLAHMDRPAIDIDGEYRATVDGVNGYVHGLDLTGGAADQTALFDFEKLHIAFDHVWQDIFDPVWRDLIVGDLAAADTLMRPVADSGDDDSGPALPDAADTLALEALVRKVETAALDLRVRSGQDRNPPQTMEFGLGDIGGAISSVAGAVYDYVDELYFGDDDNDKPRDNVHDHRGETPGRSGAKPRQKGRRIKTLNSYIALLDQQIASDHSFTAFGADETGHAVNYGVVATYRQRWDPQSYQAGELVKTLPLAPGQKMAFSTKRMIRKSHGEKRAEASENTYNSESSSTDRDISKIVRNAKFETSFTLQSKVNSSVPGVGGAESGSTFGTNFSIQSSRTKETFREQIRKEANSFRNSASVEVNATQDSEFTQETSGQVGNENAEISVTALFYELQRRYQVSERLHRATPVVLVAEQVWKPSEITPELIARFGWIFSRVLLDQSFADAIDFVSSGELVAEQAALFDLEDLMETQFDVVDALKRQIVHREASVIAPSEYKPEIFRNDRGQTVEEYQKELKDHIRKLREELRRQESRLASAVEYFNEAFTAYAVKLIQIRRLQLHIKDNVIYYMQAVWEHQDNHQTLMRLRHQQIPKITGRIAYSLQPSQEPDQPPWWRSGFRLTARPVNFKVSDKTEDLAEVADLSRPMGFFGNYRIYPLIKQNPMIDFLMVPYLSGHPGVRDPDDAGNVTVAELENYASCLAQTLPEAEFQALWPKIEAAIEHRLNNPLPDQEEIVVPTGSLFIELLPGTHSVLETFKRRHREMDVKTVEEDLITTRLEQLRMAARILSDRLGDPEIEKVVVTDRTDLDIGDI